MATEYHLKYKKINPEAVLATRNAIRMGLFKKSVSVEQKKILLTELHTELCRIYEIPVIEIVYIKDLGSVGQYNMQLNVIALNKTSLVTYLHEFCHYMSIKLNKHNSEEKARGWSISLFYLATPNLCLKAIADGLIMHEGGNRDVQH